LKVSQKLDRLFSGEPTDITRQQLDTGEAVRKIVEIMRDFVPEERWEELAEKLDGIESDG
jgi:hypothetical protein